jgi:hypothetical protein
MNRYYRECFLGPVSQRYGFVFGLIMASMPSNLMEDYKFSYSVQGAYWSTGLMDYVAKASCY